MNEKLIEKITEVLIKNGNVTIAHQNEIDNIWKAIFSMTEVMEEVAMILGKIVGMEDDQIQS